MDLFDIFSNISLAFSLSGNILLNFRRKSGYIIWIVSNIGWIIVNIISPRMNIQQIIMYLVYIILNIHGFIIWWRKDKKDKIKKNIILETQYKKSIIPSKPPKKLNENKKQNGDNEND